MTTAVGPVPQTPTLLAIALESLVPHPANRKQFDPKKLEELTASVRTNGVLTPLLVRLHPEDAALDRVTHLPGRRYEIIAGERRWRAAKGAGLAVVNCVVRDLTDDEAIELLLTENLQREDPHPLEEADAYAAWLERPGHDVKELAARIGKSVAHVYSRLQLRQLSEAARQVVWAGQLPVAHAQVLARLAPAQQGAAVEKIKQRIERMADLYTPDTLSEFVEDLTHYERELTRAPFPIDDIELCPGAGACSRCPKRTGFAEGMFPELEAALQTAGEGDPMPDTCLDEACWDEKVAAHVARAILQARDTYGEELVLLTWKFGETYPAKEGAPLPRGVWTKVAKKTKGAVPGIIVKSDTMAGMNDAGPGDLIWVTLKPRPKAGTKAKAAAPARPSWEVDEAKRKAKAAIELPRRLAVAQAIMAKVPAKLDLDLVKWAVMGTFQGWQLTQLAKQLGVTAPKPEKSDAELNRALVLDMVGTDLNAYDAGRGAEMQQLPKLAKRFGVDLKKVLADHDAAVAKAAPASKDDKAVRGECTECGCTQDYPCIDDDGSTCSWVNKEETRCSSCPAPTAEKKAPKKRAGDVARAKKAKKKGGR